MFFNKKWQKDLFNEISILETEDFQNRGGRFPKPDIADSISVFCSGKGVCVEATFKNTDELVGRSWMKNFLAKNKLQAKKWSSYQDGEFHNDWIVVSAIVIRTSEDLNKFLLN